MPLINGKPSDDGYDLDHKALQYLSSPPGKTQNIYSCDDVEHLFEDLLAFNDSDRYVQADDPPRSRAVQPGSDDTNSDCCRFGNAAQPRKGVVHTRAGRLEENSAADGWIDADDMEFVSNGKYFCPSTSRTPTSGTSGSATSGVGTSGSGVCSLGTSGFSTFDTSTKRGSESVRETNDTSPNEKAKQWMLRLDQLILEESRKTPRDYRYGEKEEHTHHQKNGYQKEFKMLPTTEMDVDQLFNFDHDNMDIEPVLDIESYICKVENNKVGNAALKMTGDNYLTTSGNKHQNRIHLDLERSFANKNFDTSFENSKALNIENKPVSHDEYERTPAVDRTFVGTEYGADSVDNGQTVLNDANVTVIKFLKTVPENDGNGRNIKFPKAAGDFVEHCVQADCQTTCIEEVGSRDTRTFPEEAKDKSTELDVEFKTGITCSDVSSAQVVLRTKYKLHDITFRKAVITYNSKLWNPKNDNATKRQRVEQLPESTLFDMDEVNEEIERRDEVIDRLVRLKDVESELSEMTSSAYPDPHDSPSNVVHSTPLWATSETTHPMKPSRKRPDFGVTSESSTLQSHRYSPVFSSIIPPSPPPPPPSPYNCSPPPTPVVARQDTQLPPTSKLVTPPANPTVSPAETGGNFFSRLFRTIARSLYGHGESEV